MINKISVLLVVYSLIVSIEAGSLRQKRSIFQLCNLINYYTNRPCTDYNDYGCFCGYGQEGRKPMDETDACCRKHDNCYGRARCMFMYPQFVSFNHVCDEETRECRCTDEWGTCARSVCECEIELASCLRRYPYHNTYYHMDRSKCL